MDRDALTAQVAGCIGYAGGSFVCGGVTFRGLRVDEAMTDPLNGTVRETRITALRSELGSLPRHGATVTGNGQSWRVVDVRPGVLGEVVELICVSAI